MTATATPNPAVQRHGWHQHQRWMQLMLVALVLVFIAQHATVNGLSFQDISDGNNGMKSSTENVAKKGQGFVAPHSPNKAADASEISGASRRDVLVSAASSVLMGGSLWTMNPNVAHAAALQDDMKVDMNAINAARSTSGSSTTAGVGYGRSVVPLEDPSPVLTTRRYGANNKQITTTIPRIGYSLYKTKPEQAEQATALALLAGVRYFDVGSQYGSNTEVAKAVALYLNQGLPAVEAKYGVNEKPALLERYRATVTIGEEHAIVTTAESGGVGLLRAPSPMGSIGRSGRRDGLYLSHKLCNEQQSTNREDVRRSVKKAMKELGVSYLDMVCIHSPLTNSEKRLASWEALLELQRSGLVKAVGVCNYGLGPLQELQRAFPYDLPAMNQLEISPFNQHKDIVMYCAKYGIGVGCGTWSKLSSSPDILAGWDQLGDIANAQKMTKAQILVRWALQKGYTCVPRSAPSSKVEKIAIAENTYGGVNANGKVLSAEQMAILDGLDVGFASGKLGRRDGWEDGDVKGDDWEPTNFV